MTENQPSSIPEARTSDPQAVAAANVAGSVAVVSIRFVSFSALTGARFPNDLPEKVEPRIGFTEPVHERHENLFSVRSTFLCRLNSEQSENSAPLFDLRATTELIYAHDPEKTFSDHEIAAFVRLNAPFNAWSYWRELTQSSLARLGLPVFPLPLFRLGDLGKLIVKEDEER